jgi:uncharacterized membrane protein
MPRELPTPARLEAFSDGVIAVIITIMVLELKIPHGDGPAGLLAILPALLIYALSFTFTGIYWINHHHLVDRIEFADQRILYANLGFLFCLSLLTFFTAYVLEKKIDAFSVALYAISMVGTGFSFLLLRLAITQRLRRTGELNRKDAAAQRKHWLSLALYLLAIPVAYLRPHLALADIALVNLIWILPSIGVEPSHEHPSDSTHGERQTHLAPEAPQRF